MYMPYYFIAHYKSFKFQRRCALKKKLKLYNLVSEFSQYLKIISYIMKAIKLKFNNFLTKKIFIGNRTYLLNGRSRAHDQSGQT